MRDEMNRNALTVTGTPVLATGALTVDTDQALTFNGTTNSAAAAGSASLSIASSMSIELFIKLAALPGSTKDIVRKTGSYAVQIDSTGHVIFSLTGIGTLTSNVTLTTGTFHHIVCVYNNNYSGAQRFGNATIGTTTAVVDDDSGNNEAVTQVTMLEQGILKSASMSLQYIDSVWPVSMQAVVYSDAAGVPDALVTQSDVLTLNAPMPAWRSPTWVTFPLTPVTVPAGTYWLGYVADSLAGAQTLLALAIGATPGGSSAYKNASIGSPANPFGTIASTTSNVLSAYCDYTATNRTSNEGKALIYINGAKNVTTTASGTIPDTSNTVDICPALAATVDEISIWNKPLTSVQVATHYTAH